MHVVKPLESAQRSVSPEPVNEPGPSTAYIRLTVHDPRFADLWAQFSHRARRVWAQHAPYMPSDGVLADWLGKLTRVPDILPIWLIIEPSGKVVGHAVAEASIYHGTPFISVHQIESDSKEVTRAHKVEALSALADWVALLNSRYEEAQVPLRFQAMRFLTPHPPEFWQKWLPLEHLHTEYTLTFAIPDVKPVT